MWRPYRLNISIMDSFWKLMDMDQWSSTSGRVRHNHRASFKKWQNFLSRGHASRWQIKTLKLLCLGTETNSYFRTAGMAIKCKSDGGKGKVEICARPIRLRAAILFLNSHANVKDARSDVYIVWNGCIHFYIQGSINESLHLLNVSMLTRVVLHFLLLCLLFPFGK